MVPWWATAIVAVWASSVAAAVALSRATDRAVTLCHVRAITGVPCPTCGSTRAMLAAADGRIVEAFMLNPLVATVAAVVIGLFLLRVVAARTVRVEMSRTATRLAWSAIALLFVLNWFHVWNVHREAEADAMATSAIAMTIEAPLRDVAGGRWP